MTGRFLAVPGTSPTFPVARSVIAVAGVAQAMQISARYAMNRLVHERCEEEIEGEKDKGETLRAGAPCRYPQPWLWLIGAMAPHPPATRVDRGT